MLPPGHLAVAYLSYSLLVRVRGGAVTGGAAVTVVLASQFPDLVDKPLAWWLDVLPTGRTLAHSLLVLVPLAVLVYWAARRADRSDLALAFAVGAITHALSDAAMTVLEGEPVTFLLWPLLPVDTTGYESSSILELLVEAYTSPGLLSSAIALEGGLLVLAVWLWLRDGRPRLDGRSPQT